MEYRNLKNLMNLQTSNIFVAKNNLEKHFFERGDMVFHNDCFVIHVYAFVVEKIPYIDIYSVDKEFFLSNNVDDLIEKANLIQETRATYSKVKNEYLKPVTFGGKSNIENCLIMEQNYLTYLSILNTYLPLCFSCSNVQKTAKYLNNMNNEFKMKLKNLVHDLNNDEIHLNSKLQFSK